MIADLAIDPGSRVLDIAAGTGSITRSLTAAGAEVVSLDQSPEMLGRAVARGATGVVATAEELPFTDNTFDGATFGYLLRYVDSVPGAMREIGRTVRSGGRIGMVEFGRPSSLWRPLWWFYTRVLLPVAGMMISRPWHEVGSFLGPSIDAFSDEWTPDALVAAWMEAGFAEVRIRRMSLGGGLVITATKQ